MEREILVYILSILCIILLIFIVYFSALSTAIYGSWSAPTIYPCTGTKENAVAYYEYACQPNPVTGLGCVVNGTTTVLYKNMIRANKCDPTNIRDISFIWQFLPDKSNQQCHSDGSPGCCATDATNCFTEASYCCTMVGEKGGENQCTLARLNGTLPPGAAFDPDNNGGYLCS